MKFPYSVKYNGVIYPPNTEITEDTETKTVETVKDAPKKGKGTVKGDK